MKYKIVPYVRIEIEESEDTLYNTKEEAEREINEYDDQTIYKIEEVKE